MVEVVANYEVRVSGLWNRRAVISGPEGRLGLLEFRRNRWGLIVAGKYVPEKGEVLHMRRDPGILRSQFSLWTEGREWLGAALRSSFFGREIALPTGNKPYRLVPLPHFGRGWRLLAPKTGEMLRFRPVGFGRRTTIQVLRRIDFELVIFAYFLGAQIYSESWWPGRREEADQESLTTPSKA